MGLKSVQTMAICWHPMEIIKTSRYLISENRRLLKHLITNTQVIFYDSFNLILAENRREVFRITKLKTINFNSKGILNSIVHDP